MISEIASSATAVGVILAWWQLRTTKEQARTAFEDSMSAQYRALMRELPVEALLGEPLNESMAREALPVFFHYFDLCNEQAYLHKKRRVRPTTWAEWREGIETNMQRPAFEQAWLEISSKLPTTFDDLKEIVNVPPVGRGVAGALSPAVVTS